MKKLTLVATIGLGLLLLNSVSAHAFSLGGYTGDVIFEFQNWDVGTLYRTPTSLTGIADGNTDSFSLLKVQAITDTDGNNLWTSSASEALEGWVYGLDDDDVTLNSVGAGTIDSNGGHLAMYLGPSNMNITAANAPTMPRAGLGAPTDLWKATDGPVTFLTMDIVPGIDLADANTTYFQQLTSITNPTVGDGSGYLKITGGDFAELFDTNGYNSIFPGADMFFQNHFNSNDLTTGQRTSRWLVKSAGTTFGTAIPEPTTMILMGMGLAGLAFRKKKAA